MVSQDTVRLGQIEKKNGGGGVLCNLTISNESFQLSLSLSMKASNLSLDNNTPSALHFAYPVSTVTSKHLRPPPPPPPPNTSHHIASHTSTMIRYIPHLSGAGCYQSIRYHQTCLQPWIQHNTTQYKTISYRIVSYRMYLQARPSTLQTPTFNGINIPLPFPLPLPLPAFSLSVRHILEKSGDRT